MPKLIFEGLTTDEEQVLRAMDVRRKARGITTDQGWDDEIDALTSAQTTALVKVFLKNFFRVRGGG